jgi:hypothetical protein
VSVHVHVGRSGGFAGLRLEGDVDTSALAPDERGRLEQLVAHLRSSRGPSGPDLFQYDLTITTDDGVSRDVTLHESDVPDQLRPLLAAALRPSAGG